MRISNFKFQISNDRIKAKDLTVIASICIFFLAAFMRLIPHPANVAPIAAMALFGGAHVPKKYAFILPVAAMFISDLFIGLHNTMIFVYASFLFTVVVGVWLKSHKKVPFIIAASLFSSLLFFVITNFGVWLLGGLYSKNMQGLATCYTLALPFFRNTLLGDLFYNGIFFAGFTLLERFNQQKNIAYDKNIHKNRR